jgi:hypothetical protein
MSKFFRFQLLILAAIAALTAVDFLAAKQDGKNASGQPERSGVSGSVYGEVNTPIGNSGSATISAGVSFGEARQLAVDHHLTGNKPLPPGIRKNLQRGKPLPPGIAKQQMPGSFVSGLPHYDGYEWNRAGTDLVLVVSGSLVISDVIENVFD